MYRIGGQVFLGQRHGVAFHPDAVAEGDHHVLAVVAIAGHAQAGGAAVGAAHTGKAGIAPGQPAGHFEVVFVYVYIFKVAEEQQVAARLGAQVGALASGEGQRLGGLQKLAQIFADFLDPGMPLGTRFLLAIAVQLPGVRYFKQLLSPTNAYLCREADAQRIRILVPDVG